MLVVQVEKPENEPLGGWFSEIRTWLDVNNCTPSAFVRTGRRLDRLIYRISFDDPVKAREFSRKFARYAPLMRRPTLLERRQFRASAGADATERLVG
jgi:hypothetical protein